mmetsp:Transcript_34901/g.81632  ORF Transcript_34901/g.81632 Transcript_34901/m.81632 type:complete len:309 (+) Transcript_34901:63-989(+)
MPLRNAMSPLLTLQHSEPLPLARGPAFTSAAAPPRSGALSLSSRRQLLSAQVAFGALGTLASRRMGQGRYERQGLASSRLRAKLMMGAVAEKKSSGRVLPLLLVVISVVLLLLLGSRSAALSSSAARDALVGTALGLLSSSCCVLQLVLNSFSLGCAGFAALDAWRTPARVLTLTVLLAGTVACRLKIGVWWPATPQGAAVCGFIALLLFSPELLRSFNQASARGSEKQSFITLAVPEVKCEACASRLRGVVAESLGRSAAAVSVRFAEPPQLSYVDVQAAPGVARDSLANSGLKACESLGYKPSSLE